MRKKTEIPTITGGQAKYILGELVADKRITAKDIQRYVDEMEVLAEELEQRIAELRGDRITFEYTGTTRPVSESGTFPMGKRTIKSGADGKGLSIAGRMAQKAKAEPTPSQKLQGQYLAHIRRIPKSKRGKYQKIAKTEGREAAIIEMRKVIG